jgi:hypothetical protein
MAKDIKVLEVQVVDGVPTVSGTVGEVAFTAAPFRWGSKMLMKVSDGDFDRGTRIALGHAAKRAIKAAGLALPEAVLKRPRKAKEEVAEAPKEDFTCKSVKELRQICKDRGITGHSKDGITKSDLITLLGG